jgi:hypothetical protein
MVTQFCFALPPATRFFLLLWVLAFEEGDESHFLSLAFEPGSR